MGIRSTQEDALRDRRDRLILAWARRADQNKAVGTVVRVGSEQSWSEELEDGTGEHQHHNVVREG